MKKRLFCAVFPILAAALCIAADVVPRFSTAKPVWPEGREKEWNCQVGFTAEFDGKDAGTAVLRYTGATMCRVFLNGEFAAVKLSSGRWMVKYAGNEVKLSQRGFVLVIK